MTHTKDGRRIWYRHQARRNVKFATVTARTLISTRYLEQSCQTASWVRQGDRQCWVSVGESTLDHPIAYLSASKMSIKGGGMVARRPPLRYSGKSTPACDTCAAPEAVFRRPPRARLPPPGDPKAEARQGPDHPPRVARVNHRPTHPRAIHCALINQPFRPDNGKSVINALGSGAHSHLPMAGETGAIDEFVVAVEAMCLQLEAATARGAGSREHRPLTFLGGGPGVPCTRPCVPRRAPGGPHSLPRPYPLTDATSPSAAGPGPVYTNVMIHE